MPIAKIHRENFTFSKNWKLPLRQKPTYLLAKIAAKKQVLKLLYSG